MTDIRFTTTTLNYYNKNATQFARDTGDVEFSGIQDKFISKVKKGARILDFGCGSGRDTKYFLDRGLEVQAIDGSEELCKIAAELAGIEVKQMLFEEFCAEDVEKKYDGIWACSSILHLEVEALARVFEQMIGALVDDGVIYTSFKYGEFEGVRNGRYFTDMTKEKFDGFIGRFEVVKVEEYWISGDVRPGRGDEQWLNLILRKNRG